jgi:hypothetical protein
MSKHQQLLMFQQQQQQQQQQHQMSNETTSNILDSMTAVPSAANSARLSRRMGSFRSTLNTSSNQGNSDQTSNEQQPTISQPQPQMQSQQQSQPQSPTDISEINAKELLDQIVDNLIAININQWFAFSPHAFGSKPNETSSPQPPPSPTPLPQQQFTNTSTPSLAPPISTTSASSQINLANLHSFSLFESIHQALWHIDFNLKRNSDFINELTKLLDTSRSIKQEAHLKKLLKLHDDQKAIGSGDGVAPTTGNPSTILSSGVNSNALNSLSQPSSPRLPTQVSMRVNDMNKKAKSKSFKGFASFKLHHGSTKSNESSTNKHLTSPSNATPANEPTSASNLNNNLSQFSTQYCGGQQPPGKNHSQRDLNSLTSELNSQQKIIKQPSELNNSDYTELEYEVEKISYHLDSLYRVWSKLSQYYSLGGTSGAKTATATTMTTPTSINYLLSSSHWLQTTSNCSVQEHLRHAVEFHTMVGNLNSTVVIKELEKSLFKLNWLITSKSGFSEPNWQANVLSLTPCSIDSFIGVNLLKNYYKYVKYDFVSYKLFTRQLQLTQLCAIILSIIHRILVFYTETTTLSSITNTMHTIADLSSLNAYSNNPNSLMSFTFSADKYRPISWSANHVTLYNMQSSNLLGDNLNLNNQSNIQQQQLLLQQQNTKLNPTLSSQNPTAATSPSSPNQQEAKQDNQSAAQIQSSSGAISRSSSNRRENRILNQSYMTREEHIRQIKNAFFLKELDEFIKISTHRLNLQSSLANRTGYFYIVNQSTGLVLQACDFTTNFSLKEQVEQNQKRIQNSSLKVKQTASGQSRSPSNNSNTSGGGAGHSSNQTNIITKGPRFYLLPKINASWNSKTNRQSTVNNSSIYNETASDEQLWYYYLINGCVANKIIRSGYCMAASSLNLKSPVCFWPNVKTTNCSWFFNHQDHTIVSGLNEDLVLDYIIIEEPPNQRYAVVIDTKVPNKASQKWSFEFC